MKNKFKNIEEKLNKLVEEMKEPSLSIDQMIEKAQKAYQLIKEGKEYLREAEEKVEKWSHDTQDLESS
jgi:exodeoxyribonuclease VII small subunit